MPSIAFTRHLEAVGPTDVRRYAGQTVGQLLEAVAADYPRLKGYVLDDQGRLRKHIAVFVDGAMVDRATALARRVDDGSEVYVFQALSGG
jgi:molybdopterin converting factor small subunit